MQKSTSKKLDPALKKFEETLMKEGLKAAADEAMREAWFRERMTGEADEIEIQPRE